TENANLSRPITTEEVRRLPQFGRDPYELARLTPGVFGQGARSSSGGAANLPNQVGPGGSATSIFQVENQVPITANGQRVSGNNFQIDGTSVNSLQWGGAAVITPNQESVKEVRVIANNYSAEFGRNTGAQILTTSQNGTNVFHGSLFFKYNDPALNAFNRYNGPNNAPTVRVENRFRQFGGSLGGPVYLPRFGEGGDSIWSGKDRLFFFVSYEGLRNNSTNFNTAFVETPQFRQLIQQVRPNSLAARVFGTPGIEPRITAVIPVNCGNLFGTGTQPCQAVGGALDVGSPAGAVGQFTSPSGAGLDGIPDLQFVQYSIPAQERGNQFNARIDYTRNNDSIAVSTYLTRRNDLRSDTTSRSRPVGDIISKPLNAYGSILWNRIINPTTFNEARFNATRFAFDEVSSSTITNFGIPRIEVEGYPTDRVRFGAPQGSTTPGIFAQNTFEFRDTLRHVRGNHSLTVGGEFRREQDNNNLAGNARPAYSFVGLFNLANDAPVFQFIAVDPLTGGLPLTQRYFRTGTVAAFFQDDWKARPNLTLNLGLRYEYYSPLTEKEGRLTNLDISGGLANARLVAVDKFYESDWNNFAPRVGFAYSPNIGGFGGLLRDNRAVLRGGFGVAYNRIPNVVFSNARNNPPFIANLNLCCAFSPEDLTRLGIRFALGNDRTPFGFPGNPQLAQGINPTTGFPISGGAEVYAAFDVRTHYVYS
ncbi:MAG TPA: TonB-dependent receptor, partial [Pyrinomonadaceae bacterium]|nr:TonB-dependent receptor [Pyrinomonadaceae bacterium]